MFSMRNGLPGHPDVSDTYNDMACVYEKQGKNDEALAMYDEGSVDLIEEIRRRPS